MCLVCDGATHDEVMLRMAKNVHDNTVTFIPTMGGGFAYSVGMTGLGYPELYADLDSGFPICTGHEKPEIAVARALEDVVEVLRGEERTPSIWTVLKDPTGEMPVEIRFRPWSTDALVMARKFYSGHATPVRALRVQRHLPRPKGALRGDDLQ